MGIPLAKTTLDDFLRWENEQPDKHEFHRGEIFPMVGGRRVHGRVMANLTAALMRELSGSPCQVFADSMKVQTADDTILYPDVFVTCDPADLRTEMIFRAPKLVIEVLSPTTQACDMSDGALLRLASIGCEVPLAEVFDGLDAPQGAD